MQESGDKDEIGRQQAETGQCGKRAKTTGLDVLKQDMQGKPGRQLRMTPTTAAEIADKAPFSRGRASRVSTYGAPAKIHRKQGEKVTQRVMNPAPRARGRPPS